MHPGESQATFWRNILSSSSGSKRNPRKEPALLTTCLMPFSCLSHSSALKMEATCSIKMLVDFHQTIWCYILEYRTPQHFKRWVLLVKTANIYIYINITEHDSKQTGKLRTHAQTFVKRFQDSIGIQIY
jgi:hypothetical protein